MTPNPKMASRTRAPPENRLRNPRTPDEPAWCWSRWTAAKLTPGTGTLAPSWESAITTSVNRTLFRRSGTRKMLPSLVSMSPPPPPARLPVGQGVAPGRRAPVPERRRQDLDATPGSADRVVRPPREGVGPDPNRPGELAAP